MNQSTVITYRLQAGWPQAKSVGTRPPGRASGRMACEIKDAGRFDKRILSAMRRLRICCA
jgi:hypothetical protein